MNRGHAPGAFFVWLFLIQLQASSQIVGLDSSFGSNGIVTFSVPGMVSTNGTGIELDANGKYVICGKAASQVPSVSDFVVLRVNEDGSLDSSFNGSGYTTANVYDRSFAHDLAIQHDAKILVTGQDFDPELVKENIGILRLNGDGSRDVSFGDSGRVAINYGWTEEGHTIVQLADGKVLLTGHTDYDLPSQSIETKKLNIFLARLLADGNPDPSFGVNGFVTLDVNNGSSDFSKNMVLSEEGTIICAGATSKSKYQTALLVRFTADGIPDSSFGVNGIAQNIVGNEGIYWRIALQPDGRIVAVGQTIFTGLDYDFMVQRFNADGAVDSGFATNGTFTMSLGKKAEKIEDVAIQSDGKIVCAGYSANSEANDATGDAVVFRLTAEGDLDESFGSGGVFTQNIVSGFDETKACMLDLEGNIVVAGYAHNQTAPGGSIFVFRLLNDLCASYEIIPSGSLEFCQGGSVDITVYPAASSYQWFRNGIVIPGATVQTYSAQSTGSFSCTVSDQCGEKPVTAVSVVENKKPKAVVSPSGTVSICAGQKVKLQANTGTGLSYQWNKNGIEIPGATNSSIKVSEAAHYHVVTANQFGCTKSSAETNVIITCRNAVDSETAIILFPNPARQTVSISCTSDIEWNRIEIFSMDGELIRQQELAASPAASSYLIDTGNLPSGCYLIQVHTRDQSFRELLMVFK
jgi:uncharacterized delta-60 repeat protein